jgi:hypothetical protein
MSQCRQTQWTLRITRLLALRDSFTSQRRYDRAYKAHMVIQRVYDQWADEVFAHSKSDGSVRV